MVNNEALSAEKEEVKQTGIIIRSDDTTTLKQADDYDNSTDLNDSEFMDAQLSVCRSPESDQVHKEAVKQTTSSTSTEGGRSEKAPVKQTNGVSDNGVSRLHVSDVRSVSDSDRGDRTSHVDISSLQSRHNNPTRESALNPVTDDSDELPPTPEDEVELPIPPDGGWGWVIVAVSFFCCSVVDGLCSVFGVLLPYLVVHFQETSSKTSLAGSVLAGGFLLSGPLASAVINCFGCRWATILGAIVSTVALIASTFSSNVVIFILVFGGLGGLGIGLIYLPASVMVGYYFEKRRGIAAGISSAGAGVGMLVLSPLAAYLVEECGWQGCLIIMAGVILQCLICGSLMRPLTSIRSNIRVLKPDVFLDRTADDEDNDKRADRRNDSLTVINENVTLTFDEKLDPKDPFLSPIDSELKIDKRGVCDNSSPVLPETLLSPHAGVAASCFELAPPQKRDSICSNKPFRRLSDRAYRPTPGNDYRSCQELRSPAGDPAKKASIDSNVVLGPMMRKDIFYSGSVASLHHSALKLSVTDHDDPVTQAYRVSRAYMNKTPFSRLLMMLKEMLDVSILLNPSFLLICLANTFIQLAFFVPIVFLPAYAQSLDMPASQGATLLAVMGVSTMFGRAISGSLASVEFINVLHLNNLPVIGAGILTAAVVFFDNYHLLIAYSAVFGLLVSVFVPLTTIFLVKYIGLDKLTNSFGLLCMVKGISTMAGPPIAGALLDSTKSYSSSFFFAGSMFMCAGLVFYALPLTQRPKALKNECTIVHCTSNKQFAQKTDDKEAIV